MAVTGAITISAALSNPAQAADFNFAISGYQTAVQNPDGTYNSPLPDAGLFSGSFSTVFADSTTPITNISQITAFTATWSGSSVDARLAPFSLSKDQLTFFSYTPATGTLSLKTPILGNLPSPDSDLEVVGLFLNALAPFPGTFPPQSGYVIAQSPSSVVVSAVPEPAEYLGTAVAGLLLGGVFLKRRLAQSAKSNLDL